MRFGVSQGVDPRRHLSYFRACLATISLCCAVVLLRRVASLPGGGVEMLETRQLLVVTVTFLHLAWLPNISKGSQTSALETKSNAVQEIKPDLTWKNKVIEVLQEFLREKIKTPPATVSETLVITNQWTRRKASHLSRQINATRIWAQNILGLVREINETASQLLWERSAKDGLMRN